MKTVIKILSAGAIGFALAFVGIMQIGSFLNQTWDNIKSPALFLSTLTGFVFAYTMLYNQHFNRNKH